MFLSKLNKGLYKYRPVTKLEAWSPFQGISTKHGLNMRPRVYKGYNK